MGNDTIKPGQAPAMGAEGNRLARQVMAQMRAYWEGLRADRLVPQRAEVDPRGIERALEYAFILDRIAPGIGRFRLAGMHLNDLMGMEVRGMPVSALFAPAGRDQLTSALESVFADPAIAELSLAADTGLGKPALAARLVLLPLRSDAGDINRCLGALVSDGMIGRTPRRFNLCESRLIAIRALREGASDPAAAPGFAESALPFAPPAPLTPEQRRAQLRLVRSND